MFLDLGRVWERRSRCRENESLLREEPALSSRRLRSPPRGAGTGGVSRAINQGKGSCRAFQAAGMRQKYPKFQSICSSPTHLLSPGKPEEITRIFDKPWNVPAWVLGHEKEGKLLEGSLGPSPTFCPAVGSLPHPRLLQEAAPSWSTQFLPVPFQGGKSKVAPQGWAWEGSGGEL